MTAQRVACAARLLYRDEHICTNNWWMITTPEGKHYDLCSSACLLSFVVLGALPSDLEAVRTETTHSEAA